MNSYNLYTKCSVLTTKPESFSNILAKRGRIGQEEVNSSGERCKTDTEKDQTRGERK